MEYHFSCPNCGETLMAEVDVGEHIDRLHRWLESCVGRHLDDVISEYTHANWMPKEFRVPHQLYKYLEVNTLKIGGQTCYHDDHHGCYRPIEECAVRTVYVHPITKQLCLYIPPTRKSWRKGRTGKIGC